MAPHNKRPNFGSQACLYCDADKQGEFSPAAFDMLPNRVLL
jgi:hypothetical protein